MRQEILDHNITYVYRYALIVGSLEEIRRTVYAQRRGPALRRFRFARDRQHWWYWNAKDAGWPIKDELKVSLSKPNPQLLSPTGFWPAESAPRLEIEAAFQSNQSEGRVYWARADAQSCSAERSPPLAIIGDGKFRKYTVNPATSREYRGPSLPFAGIRCRAARWAPPCGSSQSV